jgi:hypothetical protein
MKLVINGLFEMTLNFWLQNIITILVTIDGVWIDISGLLDTACDYTLQFTSTHTHAR